MTRLRVRLLLFLLLLVYWLSAIWVLFHACPVFDDGYGLEVYFYWGTQAPGKYPEIAYSYLAAASILTLLSSGTIWWLRRVKTGAFQTLLLSWLVTFVAFCLAVAVSDTGTAYHIWEGPTAFGTGTTRAGYYRAFLYVLIRMSFLSGLMALLLKKVLGPTDTTDDLKCSPPTHAWP